MYQLVSDDVNIYLQGNTTVIHIVNATFDGAITYYLFILLYYNYKSIFNCSGEFRFSKLDFVKLLSEIQFIQ